jgi:hypothetical protein
MRHQGIFGLGLALLLSAAPLAANAQYLPSKSSATVPPTVQAAPVVSQPGILISPSYPIGAAPAPTQAAPQNAEGGTAQVPEGTQPETRQEEIAREEGAPTTEEKYGPAPPQDAKCLQNFFHDFCWGDQIDPCTGKAKPDPITIFGWTDFDYTYRSTGPGQNNIAPVMNRFGDEFLVRELGLAISKPLDPKDWSWGFNIIMLGGADGAFLNPTAGAFISNPDPRFGFSFTDLNLTAHLPILTEGGVDLKIGRQTTVLGPMGAVAWARWFDSSDYAWYNLEEGRYTGISADWHISKQLDWYNGLELGWGTFFDTLAPWTYDYITQVNYWLDEKAEKTKMWLTVLTGPTGMFNKGFSTTIEVGGLHNWNKYVYQIIDFQMDNSHAPIFFPAPPGYVENAYDVYQYLGFHLSKCVDFNTRVEYYYDQDGGGYPGGFGIPRTSYFETTLGFDYHPNKYMQLRPEIRYDNATNPAFGENMDKKHQLSIACDLMLKF